MQMTTIQASRFAQMAATSFFSCAACMEISHAQTLASGGVVLVRYTTESLLV